MFNTIRDFFEAMSDPRELKIRDLTNFCDNIGYAAKSEKDTCYFEGKRCPIYDYAHKATEGTVLRSCNFTDDEYEGCDVDIAWYFLMDFLRKENI